MTQVPLTLKEEGNTKYTWTGVSLSEVGHMFPLVQPFIEEALGANNVMHASIQEYQSRIISGYHQMWVLLKEVDSMAEAHGVLLTTLYPGRGGKLYCEVPITGGGSIELWKDFFTEVLEPWCIENDIIQLEMRARNAGKRIFQPLGYSCKEVILSKTFDLSGENDGQE